MPCFFKKMGRQSLLNGKINLIYVVMLVIVKYIPSKTFLLPPDMIFQKTTYLKSIYFPSKELMWKDTTHVIAGN